LQSNLILALGRAYETSTEYNVGTFMRAIKENFAAFSRHALRERIASRFANHADLDAYVKEARIPHPSDFRRVADSVKNHRKSYLEKYRAIRDKVFAHTIVVNEPEITALFSKTNIRELQRMTTYLGRLHDGVLDAFQNGGQFTVGHRRYSVAKMLKKPKGKAVIKAIQEDAVTHTRRALQPWTAVQSERMRLPVRRKIAT
jgi:hypothetical protein